MNKEHNEEFIKKRKREWQFINDADIKLCEAATELEDANRLDVLSVQLGSIAAITYELRRIAQRIEEEIGWVTEWKE